MSNLTGNDRAHYVQKMFGDIAPKYDLLNRLMTGGQDIKWRKTVVEKLTSTAGGRYLDVGTGTGDLAYTILEQEAGACVVAADFTLEMVLVGKRRDPRHEIQWVIADAQNLPFKNATFNGVVSGFLLRNVPHPEAALREQARVVSPGGRVVSLDTTPPKTNLLYPLIWFHLHVIIPALGKLIAGHADAYIYLPETTEKFLTAEKLAGLFETVGLAPVAFSRRMFGTMAIHWGVKNNRSAGETRQDKTGRHGDTV